MPDSYSRCHHSSTHGFKKIWNAYVAVYVDVVDAFQLLVDFVNDLRILFALDIIISGIFYKIRNTYQVSFAFPPATMRCLRMLCR